MPGTSSLQAKFDFSLLFPFWKVEWTLCFPSFLTAYQTPSVSQLTLKLETWEGTHAADFASPAALLRKVGKPNFL